MPHPAAAALEEIARRVTAEAGFELRGVQVFTHRIPMTVQVTVQRGDGADVSLEECAALSAPLGEALEAIELLAAPYVLEVSSPGIGEDLQSDRDFASFRGFPVEVRHREGSGPETVSGGLLLGRDEATVQLNVRGRTVRIPRDQVLGVRLVSPDGPP